MNHRFKKIISTFQSNHIDALLVVKEVNVSYLTQFSSSESWLLVTAHKAFYVTDARYILEAKQGLMDVEVREFKKSFYETLFDIAGQQKIRKLGFDGQHITLAQFKTLQKSCPKSIKLIETNSLVENLREVKEKEEIVLIKKALKVHQEAYQFLHKIIKPGLTEKKVLFKLQDFVREQGVGFSFSPIIASGPNSCFPHAKVTDRRIRNNEPVLVDFGIDVSGYKSDLTRMFFLGKIPQLIKDACDAVRDAQRRAIKGIKAGKSVAEIDQLARNYLSTKDLAKYFGHALGHGVGLEIHESPRLSQKSSAVLKDGMVITVEPAVYIPHQFGIRIEDMVLVTKEGKKVLSGNID